MSLDARALRAYRARVASFLAELEGYAKKRGLFYGRFRAGEDQLEELLLSYLRVA